MEQILAILKELQQTMNKQSLQIDEISKQTDEHRKQNDELRKQNDELKQMVSALEQTLKKIEKDAFVIPSNTQETSINTVALASNSPVALASNSPVAPAQQNNANDPLAWLDKLEIAVKDATDSTQLSKTLLNFPEPPQSADPKFSQLLSDLRNKFPGPSSSWIPSLSPFKAKSDEVSQAHQIIADFRKKLENVKRPRPLNIYFCHLPEDTFIGSFINKNFKGATILSTDFKRIHEDQFQKPCVLIAVLCITDRVDDPESWARYLEKKKSEMGSESFVLFVRLNKDTKDHLSLPQAIQLAINSEIVGRISQGKGKNSGKEVITSVIKDEGELAQKIKVQLKAWYPYCST